MEGGGWVSGQVEEQTGEARMHNKRTTDTDTTDAQQTHNTQHTHTVDTQQPHLELELVAIVLHLLDPLSLILLLFEKPGRVREKTNETTIVANGEGVMSPSCSTHTHARTCTLVYNHEWVCASGQTSLGAVMGFPRLQRV